MQALLRRLAVLAVALMPLVSPRGAVAQETYTNPTLGFSISKPASWHYATAEQHRENLARADFTDPKFKELVTRYSRTPFLAITRHKEPHPDLNPSVRVNVRELGGLKGQSPEALTQILASSLAKVLKDFTVAEGPKAIQLSGHPAAYLRANYMLEAAGQAFPTTSELWIVPRGDMFFMIGAGTRQDEKSGTRKEVKAIIDTIKIR